MRAGAWQHPAHRDTERGVSLSKKMYFIVASKADKRLVQIWHASAAHLHQHCCPQQLECMTNLDTEETFFKRAPTVQ